MMSHDVFFLWNLIGNTCSNTPYKTIQKNNPSRKKKCLSPFPSFSFADIESGQLGPQPTPSKKNNPRASLHSIAYDFESCNTCAALSTFPSCAGGDKRRSRKLRETFDENGKILVKCTLTQPKDHKYKLYSPTIFVIPKSLKVGHWLSQLTF